MFLEFELASASGSRTRILAGDARPRSVSSSTSGSAASVCLTRAMTRKRFTGQQTAAVPLQWSLNQRRRLGGGGGRTACAPQPLRTTRQPAFRHTSRGTRRAEQTRAGSSVARGAVNRCAAAWTRDARQPGCPERSPSQATLRDRRFLLLGFGGLLCRSPAGQQLRTDRGHGGGGGRASGGRPDARIPRPRRG